MPFIPISRVVAKDALQRVRPEQLLPGRYEAKELVVAGGKHGVIRSETEGWALYGDGTATFDSAIPWQTWTPTVSGFTVGTGSIVARYVQIGKTVHLSVVLTYGATSTFTGLLELTLPVPASTETDYTNMQVATAHIRDGASASYLAAVYINSTDELVVRVIGAAGTYANYVSISDSVPMTWASADTLKFVATYEAA